MPLGPAEHARLTSLADDHAASGVRLLAVAVAEVPPRLGRYRPADQVGLTLAGFVGFRDRPKDSAATALHALASSGVAVKIVTGDHPLVAARACREVGLDPSRVVPGDELDLMTDEALARIAARTVVFARVGPEQKARVVRALRASGRVVGYLGDGINDAPALRAADVGISVEGGVDVARESAEVILARKDLTALYDAVAEGRRTFANIIKYIKITVSSNVGNATSMLAATAFLPFLPMLPVQVLLQNLCFDFSQLAVAFDRVDDDGLHRPRTFDRRDLTRFVACFGLVNTLADLVTFVMLWRLGSVHHSPFRKEIFRSGLFTENLLTQAIAVLVLRSRSGPSLAGPGRLPGSLPGSRPAIAGQLAGAIAGQLAGAIAGQLAGAIAGQLAGAIAGQLAGAIPAYQQAWPVLLGAAGSSRSACACHSRRWRGPSACTPRRCLSSRSWRLSSAGTAQSSWPPGRPTSGPPALALNTRAGSEYPRWLCILRPPSAKQVTGVEPPLDQVPMAQKRMIGLARTRPGRSSLPPRCSDR